MDSELPDDTGLERPLPKNLRAEQVVLGTMMASKNATSEVYNILMPSDFHAAKHEEIFKVIIELMAEDAPTDVIMVSDALENRGELARCGGYDYLVDLVNQATTSSNVSYYAKIVRSQSTLRGLVEAGLRITQLGYATDTSDTDDLINTAHAELDRVSIKRNSEDYKPVREIIHATLENISNTAPDESTVPTGFLDLDRLCNGLHGGQMIIVAARPAMGKSTFAMDICRHAAIHNNKPVLVFSLEMDANEILKRVLAAEATVELNKINQGIDNETQSSETSRTWDRILSAANRIHKAPLFIDDSQAMSIPDIRTKARRLKQQEGLSLILLDYLQLMTPTGRVESRQQFISDVSRHLKMLAKELNVPVIAVAQLNRGPESRTDKKPLMSDLRESGSLEQDADMVLLLHRPEYYGEGDRPGEADLMIAKHRNGEVGTINLQFQGMYSRFQNGLSKAMVGLEAPPRDPAYAPNPDEGYPDF